LPDRRVTPYSAAVLRVERYVSREPARACIVALPGDVPAGGVSPFDSRIESERLSAALRAVANEAAASLAPGGALLLYGAPEWVSLALGQCPPSLDLRAWVAVACRPRESALLARSHKALSVLAPRGARLDLAPVRVPHRTCRACGDTLRDWGGRHRQMRVEGTRLGDVWADLDVDLDDPLPGPLLDRVGRVLGVEAPGRLAAISADVLRLPVSHVEAAAPRDMSLSLNRVVQGDCLEVLRALPSESVDLAFADPPYNLEKAYASGKDDRARDEYLGWCHAWLTEYARVVRPGGTVAVLTLPTWAAMHARFLLRHRALRFERWVVWDALAEPKGRGLLPAHYALLLFTKGRARRAAPPLSVEGSGDLCRRPSCVASRPPGLRAPLSDVWRDIPRIKHARYRDAHPCQLPLPLVERIVDVASPPGGVVLDAFCGTGTTGAAARALARRWVLSDVSPEYVELSRAKVVGNES
jgi:site-specific DNA-methyltransferase (adenine-specific)